MQKPIQYFVLVFTILSGYYTMGQQFCRSADRTNFISAKQIVSNPALKWKFKTQGQIYASPVMYNNLIITGSCDSTLYALNKSNAAIVWQFKSGGEIRSSVAIENSTVFFMCTDGLFYAVDAHTGKQKWTFKTEGEKVYDAWDYYTSSPAVSKGVVYFGCGDGYVYALNGASGMLLWKYKTNGIVHAAPTIADSAVLIGSFDGYFYCINTDGSLRWKFNTIGEQYFRLGEVQFHATVSGNTVFFCSRDYNVYALNIRDGGGHWVYHEPGSWTSVPAISNNRLIVTMSDSHNILAFDKNNGAKLFDTPVSLNVFSSPSLNDTTAYFGSMDGAVYKLNIMSGKISRIFQTALSKQNRNIFIGSSGKLRDEVIKKYAADITPLYTEFLKMGSIFSTIWIDEGTLYFGGADGYIYAIG